MEYADSMKGTKLHECKTNTVRKCEGVFLTCELLGMRGVQLKNCSRNHLEVSSVSWLPIEGMTERRDSKGDRINSSSFKPWNKFTLWSR